MVDPVTVVNINDRYLNLAINLFTVFGILLAFQTFFSAVIFTPGLKWPKPLFIGFKVVSNVVGISVLLIAFPTYKFINLSSPNSSLVKIFLILSLIAMCLGALALGVIIWFRK